MEQAVLPARGFDAYFLYRFDLPQFHVPQVSPHRTVTHAAQQVHVFADLHSMAFALHGSELVIHHDRFGAFGQHAVGTPYRTLPGNDDVRLVAHCFPFGGEPRADQRVGECIRNRVAQVLPLFIGEDAVSP